jgi:signal transduction histidine kinase/CheY-like chemotaxis protein
MGKTLILSKQNIRLIRFITAIAMVALVYYGLSEISRHVASTPKSVTPVWLPDGLASAVVLICGYEILPGIFIGSFLANIWAFFDTSNGYGAISSVLEVLGIAIGTTAGAGIGRYLLNKKVNYRNIFKNLGNVCQFLAFTVTLAPMINATVGVGCLWLGNYVIWDNLPTVWFTWWVSNLAGICILTPVILSWYSLYSIAVKGKPKSAVISSKVVRQVDYWRLIELIVLIVFVTVVSFISFCLGYDLEYILITSVVWSSVRFGQFISTNLIVLISIIAVIGTVQGLGTFSIQNNAQSGGHSLVLLQSFIVVIVVTTLSLIGILSEKKQAIAKLQRSRKILIEQSTQLENSKLILNENALILEQKNTALIESKKLAEQANRIKTEFLSNMSHELRTPLNGILGFVQLLQDSQRLDSQDKSDLLAIYQSGTHLLNLINDILDISKIEAGKMELQPLDVYFPAFLSDLVGVMQIQATNKNIDLIYVYAPDLPELVNVDAKRLKQILLNLLGNAIKFCEKGQVIFKVSCDNSTVNNSSMPINFMVEDSGIGIDEKSLETIFLPFEQFGESKFQTQGTGLGLPISQKIAELMGSKITVNSQIGVGSVFQFTVDIQVIESKIDSEQNIGQNNEQNIALLKNKSAFDQKLSQKLPLRILLAEDNVVNQRVVCKILDRLGYKIDVVSNGLQVLESMRSQIYDVVLMDMQMPEMNGLEATKRIISDSSFGYRPYIIALTANAMESDRYFCLEAGMNDFISKPINVDLLVEALWRSRSQKD